MLRKRHVFKSIPVPQLGCGGRRVKRVCCGYRASIEAASAFINCCVVRESKVSSYDAHLPLLTKSCVPCAHLPNIRESDRSSVLVLLLHYTNCPVLALI